MLEWVRNRRRRKTLLAPMASEPLVAVPLRWPLPAEHRQEVSVGDVTLDDRYWSRGNGGYPPLFNLVPLDEKTHFHPDVNPYFDEHFLYGHIRKRGRRQPRI